MNANLSRAFTLLELLVVIAILALLSSLMAPAVSRTTSAGQSFQCLNNIKQLILAWQLYSHENSDKIVPVLHGGEAQGGTGDPVWGKGWVEGWLDWSVSADNTNVAFLANDKWAKLARYLNHSTNVFKCPTDRQISSVQMARGWTQRVRSYSASLAIGPGNAQAGPWDSIYTQVFKTSGFRFPSPAETFVYVDEDPNSINDPAFFSPHQTSWVDIPANHHNRGTAFSFADGHAELHPWSGSITHDIHWTSYHTQRVSTYSY